MLQGFSAGARRPGTADLPERAHLGPQAPASGTKEGAIMIMAIILVVLMTLVVIGVTTNTATELSVSSNTDNSRKAFIQADSALRISVMVARILLFPSTGNLDSFLADDSDIKIEANSEEFDLALLRWNMENAKFGQRYLIAGSKSTGYVDPDHVVYKPLITFTRKTGSGSSSQSRVVATSAVSLDFSENTLVGGSLSQTSYRDTGTGKRTIIIVTTDGRVPIGTDSASSEEGSFFDGSADTTPAILTTAFQEVQ